MFCLFLIHSLTRSITRQRNINSLLLLTLNLTELIDLFSNHDRIGKGFCLTHHVNIFHLLLCEGNIYKVTNLVVKVSTVSQIVGRKIFIFKTKEIIFSKFFVSLIETLGQSWISTFHQFLNTCIFGHVDKLFRNTILPRPIIRCIQCMTNLVTHEHIVHSVGCPLPHRKSQDTTFHIKLCGLHIGVLNHHVLSGKEFSELGLDFVVDHGCLSRCTYNTAKPIVVCTESDSLYIGI